MLEPLPGWDLAETWDTFPSGTFHGRIRGVEIQKSDHDLARYRRLAEISQPEIVIEAGTRQGGSALWFHHELGVEVVSIDVAPQWGSVGPPYRGPGIEWLTGHSSTSGAVVRAVLPLVEGKRVMVSLDSDHHSPHVLAEMAVWAPLVSPGCYLVVEDGCFDVFNAYGQPDWARLGGQNIPEVGGPLHALRTSGIAASGVFLRDESLEGLTAVSHSPCGWWRRQEWSLR